MANSSPDLMIRGNVSALNGLIIVDKPPFLTSHDVVYRIRRLTGIKRVGHAGTLDPFATGVVVVAVGKATRLLQYVQDADKQYLAHVVLGAETDSADVDGTVVARNDTEMWPEVSAVQQVLSTFIGTVQQVPPIFSAIKVDGQPLYRGARAGLDVQAPTRTVTIRSIDLIEYDPPDLVIAVHCGKGTYVRSIARDIGAALGTYAYCHGLRRVTSGPFSVEQSWSIEELFKLDPREHWHRIALHPDFAVHDLRAVVLSRPQAIAWYHGQSFEIDLAEDDRSELVRIYSLDGDFAGVGKIDSAGSVKPVLVFDVTEESEFE
jgi:tRNA pseudouridine55 synthase